MDLRNYGIGAQILRDLNVGRMRLLAKPRKMPSMGGFDLEVTGYENAPPIRKGSLIGLVAARGFLRGNPACPTDRTSSIPPVDPCPSAELFPATMVTASRVGIVLSRFNAAIGEGLLAGALRALKEAGVADVDITVVSVPGALESSLALQQLAQTDDFDALVALGAVIRGETYHFEIVANESAAGLSSVALEFGIPIANGILTCETDAQAEARMDAKGFEAAQAALEMANLIMKLDDD